MRDLIHFLNRPQCLTIPKPIRALIAVQDRLIRPTTQLLISRTQGLHTPRQTFSDSRPLAIIRNRSLPTRYLLRNHTHRLLLLVARIIRMAHVHLSYQTLRRILVIATRTRVRLHLPWATIHPYINPTSPRPSMHRIHPIQTPARNLCLPARTPTPRKRMDISHKHFLRLLSRISKSSLQPLRHINVQVYPDLH